MSLDLIQHVLGRVFKEEVLLGSKRKLVSSKELKEIDLSDKEMLKLH